MSKKMCPLSYFFPLSNCLVLKGMTVEASHLKTLTCMKQESTILN